MRQRALEAIPPGVALDFKMPLTLATWQAQGTYTISSTSSTKFTVTAAPTDFGGALLSDAAFHLDHAIEHQASMMHTLGKGHWTSPAWQVVTVYYWAYFSAMALSRILGHTVWFVTPEVARQVSRLAPAGSKSLTRGTYELSCEPVVNSGSRDIQLEKRSRRLHEQLWVTLFELLNRIYQEVGAGVASAAEERLYLTIIDSARVLGSEWPSMLRNLVNYRPGFAYTAPRFRSSIDSFNYLSTQKQTIEGLVDRLENCSAAMRQDPTIEAQPKVAATMLADFTLLLSLMANTLHDEIVDRTGVDRRWLNNRRRFAHQQGLFANGVNWPC